MDIDDLETIEVWINSLLLWIWNILYSNLNTKIHVEISLIWSGKIFISNKISLKICGIAKIFYITCNYKDEDALTVDKSTSKSFSNYLHMKEISMCSFACEFRYN